MAKMFDLTPEEGDFLTCKRDMPSGAYPRGKPLEEKVWYPRYDALTFAAGAAMPTSIPFFSRNLTGALTALDTNMEKPNTISAPSRSLFMQLCLKIEAADPSKLFTDTNNETFRSIYQVLKKTWITANLIRKEVLTVLADDVPGGNDMVASYGNTVAAAAAVSASHATNGVQSVSAAWIIRWRIYPETQFFVNLQNAGGLTPTADLRVKMILKGWEIRPSQ